MTYLLYEDVCEDAHSRTVLSLCRDFPAVELAIAFTVEQAIESYVLIHLPRQANKEGLMRCTLPWLLQQ